jgi:hypothetical protein
MKAAPPSNHLCSTDVTLSLISWEHNTVLDSNKNCYLISFTIAYDKKVCMLQFQGSQWVVVVDFQPHIVKTPKTAIIHMVTWRKW